MVESLTRRVLTVTVILCALQVINGYSVERCRLRDDSLRKKRSFGDRNNEVDKYWSLPVSFSIDKFLFNSFEIQTIRNGMQHWMDNTCVRFKELNNYFDMEIIPHIAFTKSLYFETGCWSKVGVHSELIRHEINLDVICFEEFGTVVHEIGHALGLWHEQQRKDRDLYIQIEDYIKTSIFNGAQYEIHPSEPLIVPYEYSSVMQYPASGFTPDHQVVMKSLNPLYQRNMGQGTGLSFGDAKFVNLIYCKDICKSEPPMNDTCLWNGYQDPNDCSKCKCPDGLDGILCDQVSPQVNAQCGGTVTINSRGIIIESPGYALNPQSHYTSHTECTWWIKARKAHKIHVEFVDDFAVYCKEDVCFHWIEIKYEKDLGKEGPRFCCNSRPNVTITSEKNEMMILFRSNFTVDTSLLSEHRGFRAKVYATKTRFSEKKVDFSNDISLIRKLKSNISLCLEQDPIKKESLRSSTGTTLSTSVASSENDEINHIDSEIFVDTISTETSDTITGMSTATAIIPAVSKVAATTSKEKPAVSMETPALHLSKEKTTVDLSAMTNEMINSTDAAAAAADWMELKNISDHLNKMEDKLQLLQYTILLQHNIDETKIRSRANDLIERAKLMFEKLECDHIIQPIII